MRIASNFVLLLQRYCEERNRQNKNLNSKLSTMVKHIVLFQVDKNLPEEKRREEMRNFKEGIEKLPKIIECIRHIEVGFNVNPAEAWDICLNGDFDTMEDVVAYANDPRHKAVAGALKPYLTGRSCVDYEC